MEISTAIRTTALQRAIVVAGKRGLKNEIQRVQVVDHPDVTNWVGPGALLLSTGYNWPKGHTQTRDLILEFKRRGLAGVVLAVPNILSSFPEESVLAAEEVDLPLLEIDWTVPFNSITEEIGAALIRSRSALLERAEQINRELTSSAILATSLQDLSDRLSGLLGRDVNVVDRDGELLAATNRVLSWPDGRERELHYFGIVRRQVRRNASGDGSRPIFLDPVSETCTPRRLGCPVCIQGEMEAFVFLDQGGVGFSDLDVLVAEHACLLMALQLKHMQALREQEEKLGLAVVGSLLEGTFDGKPNALERARLIGWDPKKTYRICLILLDEPLPLLPEGNQRRDRLVGQLRYALEAMGQSALIFAFANQVSFLLDSSTTPEVVWAHLGCRGASMAVSRPHQGAEGMAIGAKDVHSLGDIMKPDRVHHFHEVMFSRALMGDEDARNMFVQSKLARILEAKNGDLLLETLEALCVDGFQLASTARRLAIHISTLRYRLERIELALGVDLEEKDKRFELQVAVALHQLTSKE